MKVKLKPYIKETGSVAQHYFKNQQITVDKWYDGLEVNSYYLIKCDDEKLRKFIPNLFVTAEEWRDSQLQKLI